MSRVILPMRGAALGRIASALRLSGKTVGNSPTRKRLFADSAEVSEPKLAEAIRELVDGLFTPSYLASRGFQPADVHAHNSHVANAIHAALERWNAAASLFNAAIPHVRLSLPDHLAMLGVTDDVMLRIVAYDVLFGGRHPIRELLIFLLRGGAVREWWRVFARCLTEPLSLNELVRRSRLHRETLKNLRKGELKTGGVLAEVAAALGRLGARDALDRLFDFPRVEFELRVAVALGELQQSSRKYPEVADLFPADFAKVIRHELSQMDRAKVEDLLARGTLSTTKAELQPAVEHWCFGRIIALVEPERRFAEYLEALQRAGRHEEAGKLYHARGHAMSEQLRQMGPGDEVVKAFADYFEWDAKYAQALSRFDPEPPQPPKNLNSELKAAVLLLKQRSRGTAQDNSEEEAIREAMMVAPQLREPRSALADLLSLQGRHDEAISLSRELLSRFPEDFSVLEELIERLVFAERGQDILEALAESPRITIPLRAARGAALVMLDRLEEAEREIDPVLAEDGRNQTALRAKAQLLRKRGNARDASVLERRANHLLGGGFDRVVAALAGRKA